MPHVSVVVPNYNHARFLARRIESILQQTYQHFELILLDDASTDTSATILEKYRSDERVKIVVNETNSGSPFPQWNKGVELARGEYVWIAEADDDAEAGLLEALVNALDEHPSAVLACCHSVVIDELGRRLDDTRLWNDELDDNRWKADFFATGADEVRRYLVFKNTIPNASAVVFRRSAYVDIGMAPTTMRLCGDWMTWARLFMEGDIAFVSAPLNFFRQHPGTVRSATGRVCLLEEWMDVIIEVERRLGIPTELRSKLALILLNEWRSEYWFNAHHVETLAMSRANVLLWRLDRSVALRFFVFFFLRKTLGRNGLLFIHPCWRRVKRGLHALRERGSHH